MNKKLNIEGRGSGLENTEKEQLFSNHIINNSRSMISIINRDYVYERVNKPFCNAHNKSRKTFIGKSLPDVWGSDVFRKKIKNNIDLCFTGKTVRYEASINTPKGGIREFEVIFRPIRTNKDQVTHLMAETFDITEFKRSAKETSEIKREFREMEVNFESRLLQAQRLETIGVLAGGIAHDFNNILATISGYAELLQDDFSGDSNFTEKTGKILTAVQRARSLTNQILTFSRQIEQERIYVNVNDILKETAGFVISSAPPEIRIRTDFSKLNIPVYADPTQLFRAFLNLMTNAIQSMEETGGILTVNTVIVDGSHFKSCTQRDIVADEYCLISFKDTGSGMDSSQMQKIFEPFYTTRDIGKGTGLGLSVVHGIVSELEGEILVTSKENSGSSFDIYLPLSNEFKIPGVNEEKRKKILFIKGNKYESSILSMGLERIGFDIIYASDNRQLARIFSGKETSPDLVIYMLDSDKISTQDFRRLFYKHQIKTPCILVTETNQEKLEEELVNLGVIKQHLFKPVSLKEIKNAIQISLNQITNPV